jgi:hypothetical protein
MTEWLFPLNRWRETNIVSWQRILQESIEANDKNREQFAREMLKLLEITDEQRTSPTEATQNRLF